MSSVPEVRSPRRWGPPHWTDDAVNAVASRAGLDAHAINELARHIVELEEAGRTMSRAAAQVCDCDDCDLCAARECWADAAGEDMT